MKVYCAIDGIAVGEREIDERKNLAAQFDNAKDIQVIDPRTEPMKKKKVGDVAEGDLIVVRTKPRKKNG